MCVCVCVCGIEELSRAVNARGEGRGGEGTEGEVERGTDLQ